MEKIINCIRFNDGVDMECNCHVCSKNEGFSDWGGNLPCGQQHCWYSCYICIYNNMDDDCPIRNDVEIDS